MKGSPRFVAGLLLLHLVTGSAVATAQTEGESGLRALVRLSVVEILKHARSTAVIVSTDLLDAALLPDVPGMRLEALAPDAIEARARQQGVALRYLTADRLRVQPDEAVVRLGYAWAYPSPETPRAHAGPFLNIEFRTVEGVWRIERMRMIIE